ncbi:MAG: hypothetical protein ACE5JZ_03015 [Kiloniellales bacterium]
MSLDIALPRDRRNSGTLRLLDLASDTMLCAAPCLAKADAQGARRKGNPTRDPRRPWGDAPCGHYPRTRIVWFAERTPIGEAAIPLPLETAIGSEAEAARTNGRSGLYIHAGRGSGRLRATYGCVRLGFRDFVSLLHAIGEREVDVTIHQVD